MRGRSLLKQILLFWFVGFLLISIYNSVVIRPVEQQPREVTAFKNLVPTTPAVRLRHRFPINCRKIIEYNEDEIKKANVYMKVVQPVRWETADYINKTKDCVSFRKSMRYDTYPISDEERNFPIAFSIITYKDIDQTERLLRSIYRPQNFYCIHVDGSSARDFHIAARAIADCFGNVFIVSKTEDIIYNHMNRLKADLNCMSDLLYISEKWKYFINLPHQQFPLKTNLEIVKILKIYNGANDIEGIKTFDRMMPNRFQLRHSYINKTWIETKRKTGFKLPYNASMVKGSAYGVFSRAFVQYIVKSQQSKDVLESMEDVKSPDEYYWATLNHNKVLNAPGRFLGNPEDKPWLAVYAAWGLQDRCHGKFVRGVCVFGVGDLNELISKKELFANKFHSDYQYLALDCLEEYLYNKSFSKLPFDTFYYRQLPFIIKQ